jgi:hypothetical protein
LLALRVFGPSIHLSRSCSCSVYVFNTAQTVLVSGS